MKSCAAPDPDQDRDHVFPPLPGTTLLSADARPPDQTLAAIIRCVMSGDVVARRETAVFFSFRPMRQGDAEAIAQWHYAGGYSFYDWTSDASDLAELLDPAARAGQYFAVETPDGTLVGFFQFKRPHKSDIEVGLGLHPSWTGRGLGKHFLEAGLDFARARFGPTTFRLSVATFNRRAITVYERVGFAVVRVYSHQTNGAEWEFIEMARAA